MEICPKYLYLAGQILKFGFFFNMYRMIGKVYK